MFIDAERSERLNAVWAGAEAALRERDIDVEVLRFCDADDGADLLVGLTACGQRSVHAVTVKTKPLIATLAAVASHAGPAKPLLVVAHMPRALGSRCRYLGLDYVDTAGNMYLDLPGRLIEVTGHRAPPLAGGSRRRRIFQPAGVRLVFGLLCDPSLVAAPYRTLADEAGVSLGSVQAVMTALTEEGYVEEVARARRLHRTRRLFDRWVEAYDVTLRGQLSLGSFDTDDVAPWLAGAVDLDDARWGGESAAALIGRYLRPGTATVYSERVPSALVQRYRLRRAARDGVVEFRRRFWGDAVASIAPPGCVPTPLVYADLVATGEPRLAEAARHLRENDDVLIRIDAR